MGKFYAVRVGKKPGIYTSWDECKELVIGYPGAKFKGFGTKEEAENFMKADKEAISVPVHDKNTSSDDFSSLAVGTAFVDGSFNQSTNTYGYGGFIIKAPGEPFFFSGSGNDAEMASMRNVAGEISGAMAAVKYAEEFGLDTITIYYDYSGIECWAKGEWKCNKAGTKNYAEFMKESAYRLNVKFHKVKGHTGVPGNEKADRLAKEAVGIGQGEDIEL